MKRKQPIWEIKKYEHPSDDFYNLIVRTTYTVYHKDINAPIYVFESVVKGDDDEGEETQGSGVKTIRIMTDKKRLAVTYYDGKTIKYPLRKPYESQLLTLDEVEQFMPYFLDYQKKAEEYQYAEDWSIDISIPSNPIKEAKLAMKDAFEVLEHQLLILGLNQHQAKIELPQQASKKRGFTRENLKDLELFLAEI